jgi:uncharacterized membrane protein
MKRAACGFARPLRKLGSRITRLASRAAAMSILSKEVTAITQAERQLRQRNIDRNAAEDDFGINVKAELEIELVQEKIDCLREEEISQLVEMVKCLTTLLENTGLNAAPNAGAESECDTPQCKDA